MSNNLKQEFSVEKDNNETNQEFSVESGTLNNNQVEITLGKTKIILILISLVLSILIAAVDETIVATALAAITKEFNGSGEVTWIAGAYLLTMTAFEPLYGKFSDLFGRKYCLLFSLFLFLIGSIVCGTATSLIVLIIFRAISGIAAGGLISLAFIVVSDIIPIETRSGYLSLINGTFALSYVIGPLLGGVFVDYVDWRWVFYINIPIVVVATALIMFTLPNHKSEDNIKETLKRVDIFGTITLVVGIILLVLALNWGGKEYPWSSPQVIVCLILGLIILGIFVLIEKKYAVEPVIPSKMFTPNAILLNLCSMLFGFSMFVYMYYWPLYHQTIYSSSAIIAGIETLPILVGICGFAAASGLLVNKLKFYRPFIWSGMVLLVIGNSLMARLSDNILRFEEILYPLLIGIGIGLSIQTCLVASQVAVKEEDVAIMTAFINFSLTIGGVFGLAIQGSIFNNILVNNLNTLLPDIDSSLIINSLSYLHSLPSDQHALAIQAYLTAYRIMFLSLVPFSALSLILSLFIKHIPLTTTKTPSH
ncbi:MFS general substrate transporter [Neoconidiobolus thromboides FSU 785]|nr:MFS general substrate transporter [Neoconidiobolus thromboides FSU 785]